MKEVLIGLVVIIVLSLVGGFVYKQLGSTLGNFGIGGGDDIKLGPDGGIFISKDGGRTWASISMTEGSPIRENFVKTDAYGAEFHSSDENRVFIGTSGGFYSYNISTNALEVVGNISGMVQSIAIDPTNNERMYVATKTGSGGTILKSTRTDNFYEVYSTLGPNSVRSDNVTLVRVDPQNTSIVYAGTQLGLLLESKDFGESWSVKKEFDEALRVLTIARQDSKVIYAVVGNSKIFKSVNSGETWQDISASLATQGVTAIESVSVSPRDISQVYASTGSGLFRSTNAGASFLKVNLLSADENPHVLQVALDTFRESVIYIGVGAQVHRTEDAGVNWQVKTLPTSRKVSVLRVSPVNPNLIIAGVRASQVVSAPKSNQFGF